MEGGEYCGKKARVEVKREEGAVMQDGGEGGRAVVAAEAMAEPQMDVRIDAALFHCQACLLPLKPSRVQGALSSHLTAAKITICLRKITNLFRKEKKPSFDEP